MAFNEEKHIQALVNLYRQGFINILNTLLQKERKGNVTVFYKDQLKNILEILAQLDAESAKWIQQVIPRIYQENHTQVLSFINKMGMQRKIRPQFAQVHQRAIDVIAQNMFDNLRQATQYAGRRIQDEYRRAGIDTMGEKYTEGLTWRETSKRLQERLLSQGLTGFKDKLGREWRLDSYAQMVARTTSREIATVATLNTCQEAEIDLVQISSHWPTCEICAPLQGKVFSISGNDKRYPKLEEEYTPPIHPNCRHVTTPYVREFDHNAEETQRHSNTPLDKDTRSEREKQAYKDAMDKVAIARNRKRAREVLYSNAPKDEKIIAAKKLNSTYEKSGTKPVGRDASILKQYKEHLNNIKDNDKIETTGAFKDLSITKAQSKALNDVHTNLNAYSKANHTEKLMLLDLENNKVAHELKGGKDSVVFDKKTLDILGNAPKSSLILSHNHPGSSSFSDADLHVLARFKSLKAITVEGEDGTKYICKKGNGTQPDIIQVSKDYDKIKDDLFDKYYTKVMNEELTERQAWYEHSNEIMEQLAPKYGWVYRRVRPDER
jgi:SPP1 gp7 family putative phage head morphogenesis protein